jgi:hypothetical protein
MIFEDVVKAFLVLLFVDVRLQRAPVNSTRVIGKDRNHMLSLGRNAAVENTTFFSEDSNDVFLAFFKSLNVRRTTMIRNKEQTNIPSLLAFCCSQYKGPDTQEHRDAGYCTRQKDNSIFREHCK